MLSANLSASKKKGGMSIKFVQSSDNKYVQYRLMADDWSTDTKDWAIADEGVYIENPEFIYVKTDAEDKILWAIKADGNIYFGAGVPKQIIDYIHSKIEEYNGDNIVSFLNGLEEGDKNLQQLLNEKVDKENGKSLIDADFASSQEVEDNPVYMEVKTDAEKKILEGITKEGRKEILIPIDTPSVSVDSINNPEWIYIITDKDGKLIEGIDKNGNKVYGKFPIQILNHIQNTGSFENNIWKDKKTVWFGTSIPEGGYPQIVGQILHIDVHNEAVGSSSASGGDANFYQGKSWNYAMRAMGSTVSEKMQLFYSIYNVNDSNQTVTWGGNAYGITSLPYSQSSLPTYAKAVQLRKEVLMYSYEIKLISKYLDKSGDYLKSAMNSSAMTTLGLSYDVLHDSDMDFVYHPDAFVIDHGANDATTITGDTDSRNRNTFYGAINTFIDNIYLYSPRTSIFIVSDYNCSRNVDNIIINAQTALSELWQLPLLNVKEKLPFGGIPITTKGYWDAGGGSIGNAAGRWHDDGFSFTIDGSSWTSNNDMFYSLDRTKTATQMVEKYNIRTVNGVQLYDIPQRNMYFKDGLHPSSDNSKHSIKMYANVLSELIKSLTY